MNKLIDIIMILSLPILMAYLLVGRQFHEYLGVLMLVLFIVHNGLNYRWYRGLLKGRYSKIRIFSTIINLLLLLSMVGMMASAIIISRYVFSFSDLGHLSSYGRAIHLSLSSSCFVLMSIHAGLHGKKIRKTNLPFRAGSLIICVYGVYSFYTRGIAGYIFLTTRYAIFDFNEPLLIFFVDYLSMMWLFMVIGYSIKNKGIISTER